MPAKYQTSKATSASEAGVSHYSKMNIRYIYDYETLQM